MIFFPTASSFQQRLSYSTLGDLALALIDGTVYDIVQGLLDIQHLTEKNLYNQRQKLHCEHQGKHKGQMHINQIEMMRLPRCSVLKSKEQDNLPKEKVVLVASFWFYLFTSFCCFFKKKMFFTLQFGLEGAVFN